MGREFFAIGVYGQQAMLEELAKMETAHPGFEIHGYQVHDGTASERDDYFSVLVSWAKANEEVPSFD